MTAFLVWVGAVFLVTLGTIAGTAIAQAHARPRRHENVIRAAVEALDLGEVDNARFMLAATLRVDGVKVSPEGETQRAVDMLTAHADQLEAELDALRRVHADAQREHQATAQARDQLERGHELLLSVNDQLRGTIDDLKAKAERRLCTSGEPCRCEKCRVGHPHPELLLAQLQRDQAALEARLGLRVRR
jgi:hypothetical protein